MALTWEDFKFQIQKKRDPTPLCIEKEGKEGKEGGEEGELGEEEEDLQQEIQRELEQEKEQEQESQPQQPQPQQQPQKRFIGEERKQLPLLPKKKREIILFNLIGELLGISSVIFDIYGAKMALKPPIFSFLLLSSRSCVELCSFKV